MTANPEHLSSPVTGHSSNWDPLLMIKVISVPDWRQWVFLRVIPSETGEHTLTQQWVCCDCPVQSSLHL